MVSNDNDDDGDDDGDDDDDDDHCEYIRNSLINRRCNCYERSLIFS